MKTRMIIDTDPGIDDAMAIHYAAADPDIEIVGLTTVFGNVYVEQATRNALHLLEMAGLEAPVAEGAAQPLSMPLAPPSHQVHGDEGFGDLPAATPRGKALDLSAAEFLVQSCAQNPGEVVICAIGPLTNLALALRLDPAIARNVKKVVIMGGAVETAGNITPYAEANIYHDPHAAAEVLAADWPVVLVGLDVTHEILCPASDFDEIRGNAPRIGGFIKDISEFYIHFYESVEKFGGCSLHDPAAVIAAAHPQYFTTKSVPVCVVASGKAQGQTVACPGADSPAVSVCLGVDAGAVKARFIDQYKNLD